MKASEFGHFLLSFSELPKFYGSLQSVNAICLLGEFFISKESATVAVICKKIINLTPSLDSGYPVKDLVQEIHIVVSAFGKNLTKPVTNDLVAVSKSICVHKDASLQSLLHAFEQLETNKRPKQDGTKKALMAALFDQHLSELQTSLGNETSFIHAFNAFKSDTILDAATTKKIAKAFTKETAENKQHAIKLVWGRHAALIEARAKATATGGRTAA